jgi:hypothetical protein
VKAQGDVKANESPEFFGRFSLRDGNILGVQGRAQRNETLVAHGVSGVEMDDRRALDL